MEKLLKIWRSAMNLFTSISNTQQLQEFYLLNKNIVCPGNIKISNNRKVQEKNVNNTDIFILAWS